MSRYLALPAVALWLALPLFPGLPDALLVLADIAGIAAIAASGLTVLYAAGMPSFAQGSFVGAGAYASALLTAGTGLSSWAAAPAAIAAGMAAALLLGAVTLRLRRPGFILVSIAWSIALARLAGHLPAPGGETGLARVAGLGPAAFAAGSLRHLLVWAAVAAACVASGNLLDSRTGRALRGLRDPAIAGSCGVRVGRMRLVALSFAGALAGLAGWLYAHSGLPVRPSAFGFEAGAALLLATALGGPGQPVGATLGAALVVVCASLVHGAAPHLPGGHGTVAALVYAAAAMLLLRVAPGGLWPALATVLHRGPLPARLIPKAPVLLARHLPRPGTRLLDVAKVRKAVRGRVVLDNFSLHLDAGELVGLVGPDGSGKSTALDLLSGLTRPNGGQIVYRGEDLARLPAAAIASYGMARNFQRPRLTGFMSLIEETALGAHLRGKAQVLHAVLRLDRHEEARLLGEAERQLTRVGLGNCLDLPTASLTTAQRRLAEIARALCGDPVLLLLDEPTTGLSHVEKVALALLLRRLHEEGVTILLVDQDVEFMLDLAERRVVLTAEGHTRTRTCADAAVADS